MVLGAATSPLCSAETVLASNADSRPASAARPTIAVGMKSAEIRSLIGAPARVKPVKNDEVAAEVWYYNFSRAVGTRQVVTSTQEVPYFDSMSNSIKTRQEPVYGLETTSVSETTELLMVDGVLVGTKRYRNADRAYD